MITAKNYAAKAERGLHEFLAGLHPSAASMDWSTLKHVQQIIPQAVHFALPDGGRIFKDDLRGIEGQDVRLPFPRITVEYWTEQNVENPLTPYAVHKRVAVAEEVELEDGKFAINICAIGLDKGTDKWIPVASGARAFWNFPGGTEALRVLPPLVNNKNTRKIAISLIDVFPHELINEYIQSHTISEQQALADLGHNISDEVAAVLELVEALSCVNVSHEPIEKLDKALCQRRIRDGKLPLYETRCLVLNAPISSGKSTNLGGAHSSPRQHLRRGHIRRLENKNVWVNAHTVGSKGFIKKDYAVVTR